MNCLVQLPKQNIGVINIHDRDLEPIVRNFGNWTVDVEAEIAGGNAVGTFGNV